MASSANNIMVVPVNVLWRMNLTETFDFTGLNAAGLAGKYVTINSAKDAAKFYVWFNTGSSTDPAVAGHTAIPVAIATDDSAIEIATKFATAVGGNAAFDATSADQIAKVIRVGYGDATASASGAGANVVITMTRRGRDYDLGLLEGDVSTSFEPSNYTVTAHQFGKTPLASLNQGFSKLEVTTTLQETQKSQLKELYSLYGGAFTPSNGTEIFGVGSSSQGKNLITEAGRLVLKPVNAQDDVDNFNLMLAIPVPGALVFSGENPRKLTVTWQGFVDRDANPLYNAIAIGDIGQVGAL